MVVVTTSAEKCQLPSQMCIDILHETMSTLKEWKIGCLSRGTAHATLMVSLNIWLWTSLH